MIIRTGPNNTGAIKFNINNVNKMIVDSNGNVGIGTTTPSNLLEIRGTLTGAPLLGLRITNTDTSTSTGAGIEFNVPIGLVGKIATFNNGVGGNDMDFFTGPTGSVSSNMELSSAGDLFVTGTKSFVQDHPTDPTKQIVYVALEGGEAGTYVRGTGQLVNGEAVIELPEHFGLVTNDQRLT
ncbi:hypothetical protein HYR54_13710, partial [Candidatus Acetothermia bacterium]|nr:hypothetical protein [Candidatus Acetothermia bacterium]